MQTKRTLKPIPELKTLVYNMSIKVPIAELHRQYQLLASDTISLPVFTRLLKEHLPTLVDKDSNAD